MNHEAAATKTVSDMFVLAIGACPTLRDAGRDDIADALGNCITALKADIVTLLEATDLAAVQRTHEADARIAAERGDGLYHEAKWLELFRTGAGR